MRVHYSSVTQSRTAIHTKPQRGVMRFYRSLADCGVHADHLAQIWCGCGFPHETAPLKTSQIMHIAKPETTGAKNPAPCLCALFCVVTLYPEGSVLCDMERTVTQIGISVPETCRVVDFSRQNCAFCAFFTAITTKENCRESQNQLTSPESNWIQTEERNVGSAKNEKVSLQIEFETKLSLADADLCLEERHWIYIHIKANSDGAGTLLRCGDFFVRNKHLGALIVDKSQNSGTKIPKKILRCGHGAVAVYALAKLLRCRAIQNINSLRNR